MQENLKKANIEGKTIEIVTIEDTALELVFTDGSSVFISLNRLGSTGDSLNCKYNSSER